MTLYIDTTQGHNIEIVVKKGENRLAKKKFSAKYRQAEKLLPEIKKILDKNNLELSNIEKIQVVNKGTDKTSFTALRIGVVTANALGYALGVPVIGCRMSDVGCRKVAVKKKRFNIVEPIYCKEPNITLLSQ
ncbi:hypothetical protein KKH38_03440 [Patescibacteria group bacterium]|nr:hypothetical protein [Patescibacteria group bacterium]MBU4601144.1 hypothetical protein [Patescibacteria group bacterium]MCG2697831.1 hypothetical protein [Candidatus Parcubacteria bacterium]